MPFVAIQKHPTIEGCIFATGVPVVGATVALFKVIKVDPTAVM